jgi:hypothetical protein
MARIGKTNEQNFKVAYSYAAGPARYALETRDWAAASRIVLTPTDFPWEEFPWAQSIVHFARGVGLARSNQLDAARVELSRLHEIRDSLASTTLLYWREEVFVHADAVESWIELRAANVDKALTLARAAADREDAVDKHPVTPGEVVPARELLGDMLLELDRPHEALIEYRSVLVRSPNRWNAILGAARATARAGDSVTARGYYKRVVEQSVSRTGQREALREAREALE